MVTSSAAASWFQFYIKQLQKGVVNPPHTKYEYHWYEMSFYIYSLPDNACVAFCFQLPRVLQDRLCEEVTAAVRHGQPEDMMALLQSLIIAEVSKLYDESIWTLRDHIREIEKVKFPLLNRVVTRCG